MERRSGLGQPAPLVLFVGALLATVGNALHPFIDAAASVEEVLGTINEHGSWELLHLTIAVAVVLLAGGVVLVCRSLQDTAGASWATLASVFAIVGATIFAVQIGGIDGAVMPELAAALAAADDPSAVLTTAAALWAFDQALLGLVVTLYFGALFLAFGTALVKAGAFAAWMRWTSVAAGATGVVIGPLMVLGIADEVTFYAFRVVALAVTVVAFGLAAQLTRGTAMASEPPATPDRPTAAA